MRYEITSNLQIFDFVARQIQSAIHKHKYYFFAFFDPTACTYHIVKIEIEKYDFGGDGKMIRPRSVFRKMFLIKSNMIVGKKELMDCSKYIENGVITNRTTALISIAMIFRNL